MRPFTDDDIQMEISMMLWHCMSYRGNGDIMAGRRSLLGSGGIPEDNEWIRGFQYVKGKLPKGFAAGLMERTSDFIGAVKDLYVSFTAPPFMMDAYYYNAGMPTIEVGHKLAASLMLTEVPSSVLEGAKLPFDAFKIQIPNTLVRIGNHDIRSVTVGKHLVKEGPTFLQRFAYVSRTIESGTFTIENTLGELLQSDFEDAKDLGTITLDDSVKTKLKLLNRLIAGVCLYMTGSKDSFPVKNVGKGHKLWKGSMRDPGPPLKRSFRLTKDVQHNFSSVLKDYVEGRSSKMSVQCIVCGHWKSQPYGPKSLLRKRIFIEPYWKGPVDAEIALRAHKLS